MTLSPDGATDTPHLPTRRELRAAERLREQANRDAEEAAKQQFLAAYEASRVRAAEPVDDFNDPGFGFGDGSEAFAHPAADTSSAFYASGSPDGVFDNAPVVPVPVEPEKPAPVVQTTVNYIAIGGIAAAAVAATMSLIHGASIAALPLGVLAIVLGFIGLAKRRGSAVVPAIALIVALGAAGLAGWQQFRPTDTSSAQAATTVTVTSTSATVTVKNVTFAGATTSPGAVQAPFSTSGTGDADVSASPAAATDTLSCTIAVPGAAPIHQQGQPGQPVHCTTQTTVKDTP